MKRLLAPLALCLALTPVWGQEPPAPDDGPSLLEEGARLLLRGLMAEMEPAIGDMGKALAEMEPALRQLLALIGDIRNYHAPVMLPNGDILIRRKTPDELAVPDGGEIEL
ncbi:MAG: AAA+ family ATPase [Pseudorhodobacter sp.]|nr:AAA+ family ATPase [Pseudorhodobacter sp.]